MSPPTRLDSVEELTSPGGLEAILGPVETVDRAPVDSAGYTAARHERVIVTLRTGRSHRLRLKHTVLDSDWTALSTGDRLGREAALFEEPALAGVWEMFATPVLAYASHRGEVALLMEDLTERLAPDFREPLDRDREEALLTSLASLHARFWESPALDRPWLARTEHALGMLDATVSSDAAVFRRFPAAMQDAVPRGWEAALKALPARAATWMTLPASEIAERWRALPRTLVHGDVKVANFAWLANGRVAAFDWATVGAAPCAVDLGWYLAVNATRLTRSKEEMATHYRSYLEDARGAPVEDGLWKELLTAAIVGGARMLLWSKALAREGGASAARAEWDWWAARLEECA